MYVAMCLCGLQKLEIGFNSEDMQLYIRVIAAETAGCRVQGVSQRAEANVPLFTFIPLVTSTIMNYNIGFYSIDLPCWLQFTAMV